MFKNRYIVNLAPLIDVVFILLAFLLIYSHIEDREVIDINLPQADGYISQKNEVINILLDKNNTFYFNNKEISKEELKLSIEQCKASDNFNIVADAKSNSEELIVLMQMLGNIGAKSTNITVSGK